jgi:hypothetical protein
MNKFTFLIVLIAIGFLGCRISLTEAAATSSTAVLVHDRADVEKLVREYFINAPVMVEVARCESNFRQFTDGGSVFLGGTGGGMIGVFQLYGAVHSSSALALGFDINTLEGNLGYAQHLYQKSGTRPWLACVPIGTQLDSQTQLRIELMKKLISLLQQLLALQLVTK